MKTNKFFTKMLTLAMLLCVVLLSGCSAGNDFLDEEVIPPTPNPTPSEFSYELVADGLVDSTYTKPVAAGISLFSKGYVALQYNKINKKTSEKVGSTKTFISPYISSSNLVVSGDRVKVLSRALEVYGFSVSETTKGDAISQGDSCYLYNTKKTLSLKVKTASDKDVVISGEFVSPKFEIFFDDKNTRISEVPSLDLKNIEYVKYTLDSLKTKTDQGQEAYYSFHFKHTRQASYYASKRYEWGGMMKTRASIAGDEVEVAKSTYYNDSEPKVEVLKAVVVLFVPADGKDPIETGVTYEDDKLFPKDGTEYYTSSNDKYRNYDDGTKVLDKHNSVDILVTSLLDSDPSIIVVDNIANVGAPTSKATSATKTNRTIGEYYIEKQPKSWTWTWSYGKGSVSRTISTVEEYPYIIDGSKKNKMLSSNWEVTLKDAKINNGVDYTHNGKNGKLYTQTIVWDAVYYNETRTFTGENRYFVEDTKGAQQTGWDIFNTDFKKVDNSLYNTFGDLYKIFDDGTKTFSEALNQDYAVSATPDADKNIITIPAKSSIGTPSLKTSEGTMTNRTSGKYFIEKQPKTWSFTWSGNTGVVRNVATVEEYVYYMAGANKLQMKTGAWSKVELSATVDNGTSYTHNGTKGTLYTEKLVFKATYGTEIRTLETRYNKYFVSEPDPAVITVSEVSKDYTVQTSDVKAWINFSISTTYNGQTTSKDSVATNLYGFAFDAAADKVFKKSSDGLSVASSNVSKSTSVVGAKTTTKIDLDVVLKFEDGTTSTITFPGYYTSGYVTVRGKNYEYKTPQMTVAYTNVAKVGNTTTVEENGKLYKRSVYNVSAVGTIDSKSIVRETKITVDAEIVQRVNPEKGKFLYAYKTYTPSLDNALHQAIVISWEKKIDMIVDGNYYQTVNNPNSAKVYQSVVCRRSGSGWSWSPASISIPGTGWWRYTDASDASYEVDWSWQINGSLLGITLKEGDWNQTTGNAVVKTIDEDGYTVITAYANNGSVIYTSK